MPRGDDRSFWEQTKAGRYSGEAALMRRAMRGRVRRIFGRRGRDAVRRPPVIVKQVSEARSKSAIARVARYIARLDVDYGRKEVEKVRRRAREEAGLPLEEAPLRDDGGPARRTRADVVAAAADENRPPDVFDEHGEPVDRFDVLDRLTSWGLLPDEKNLTPKGVGVLETRGVRGLAEADSEDVFGEVQGRHIVISVPAEKPGDPARFREVARRMVQRTFGEWGYPALVAVHLEHGREMHAHILVGTTKVDALAAEAYDRRMQRASTPRERFTFDSDGIMADGLREALADSALELGMDFDASRREDRPETIERVLAGEERLRRIPVARSFDQRFDVPGLNELPPLLRRLTRRVPGFVSIEADGIAERLADMEIRRLRGQPPMPAPTTRGREPAARGAPIAESLLRLVRRGLGRPADAPATAELPAVLDGLAGALRARRVFERPDGTDATAESLNRWVVMRREDTPFADWALISAPYVFGPTTSEGKALARDREFADLLRGLTDADFDAGAAPVGFRRRLVEEPAAAAASIAMGVAAAQKALAQHPEASRSARDAREGQAEIARSYERLADAIVVAFSDDYEMYEMAARLRHLARQVLEVTPIPTTGGAVAEIDRVRDLEAARVAQAERQREQDARRARGEGGREL